MEDLKLRLPAESRGCFPIAPRVSFYRLVNSLALSLCGLFKSIGEASLLPYPDF